MIKSAYSHQVETKKITEYFKKDAALKKDFYKTNNLSQMYSIFRKRSMWKTYQFILNQIIITQPNASTICDIGCGMGHFILEIISKNFFNLIVGVDNLREAIQLATNEPSMFSQAYFIQADMFSLPFKNNSFDVVFCLNTLHHFHKILFEKIIQELARITKNLLVIEIRNQIYLGNVIYAKFIIPHTYKNLPSYSYDSSYVNTLLDDEGFKMLSSRGKRAVDIMNRRLVLAYKKNS